MLLWCCVRVGVLCVVVIVCCGLMCVCVLCVVFVVVYAVCRCVL